MEKSLKEDVHLAERFEVAFNQIHASLKRMVPAKTDSFSKLVTFGAKNNSIIREYQDELYQYSRLRNAIVHDKVELGYYIAEPHEEVVNRIEKISAILSKPNYALEIATRPVITFDFEDTVEEVIQGIKIHGYSQYPIYNSGKCVGLLRARGILQWMAKRFVNGIVDLKRIKVKDIYAKEHDHPIEFVSKKANIFDVEEMFEKAHQRKSKLETIMITEHGYASEQPLGLITPWDLIEIDYTTD